MTVSVPGPGNPEQRNPPGKLQERIALKTRIQLSNEAGFREVEITYEVQPVHASHFRVAQGASRKHKLKNGTHDLDHWIVLDGPSGVQVVIELRVIAKAANTSTRGFAVRITP